eukprot:71523-Chlamydomonas_euryale.AAC.2
MPAGCRGWPGVERGHTCDVEPGHTPRVGWLQRVVLAVWAACSAGWLQGGVCGVAAVWAACIVGGCTAGWLQCGVASVWGGFSLPSVWGGCSVGCLHCGVAAVRGGCIVPSLLNIARHGAGRR